MAPACPYQTLRSREEQYGQLGLNLPQERGLHRKGSRVQEGQGPGGWGAVSSVQDGLGPGTQASARRGSSMAGQVRAVVRPSSALDRFPSLALVSRLHARLRPRPPGWLEC